MAKTAKEVFQTALNILNKELEKEPLSSERVAALLKTIETLSNLRLNHFGPL